MSSDNNRRRNGDRRIDEKGPPHGWRDRRRRTERRIPALEITEISEEEWQHYFGSALSGLANEQSQLHSELASSIFDKIRD